MGILWGRKQDWVSTSLHKYLGLCPEAGPDAAWLHVYATPAQRGLSRLALTKWPDVSWSALTKWPDVILSSGAETVLRVLCRESLGSISAAELHCASFRTAEETTTLTTDNGSDMCKAVSLVTKLLVPCSSPLLGVHFPKLASWYAWSRRTPMYVGGETQARRLF